MIVENVQYLYELGIQQIDVGPVYEMVAWTENASVALAQSMYDIAIYMRNVAEKGEKLEVGPLYESSEHIGEILIDHWGCGALSTNIAYMPDGRITGCSALAMLTRRYPELVVGDVWKGLDDHATSNLLELAQAGRQDRPSCQNCKIAPNCRGGCLAINYSTTGSPFIPPTFYCKVISSIPSAWKIAWAKE
jgi:radical SAM protein with 4Fe4S-binding SPASM domain